MISPSPTATDDSVHDTTVSHRRVLRTRTPFFNSPLCPAFLTNSWRIGVLCALLTGLAVLATYPVLEMGTTDDWSYARTALELARTGHIIYNGWATAMLGWQIVWGALVIKLFGFSFLALRLSTLPFAMGAAFLLHQICVRLGLNPQNAVLATLTVALSPLFLPLAASFMTDVPALFWLLVGLYACVRAICARSTRACILWLAFAALTNVVAGSARQIIWLGALVMVPSAAWLARRRHGVLLGAAILWIVSILAIAGCMSWFHHQPYSLPEKIIAGEFTFSLIPHVLQQMRDLLLTILLFSLPVLAGYLFVIRGASKKVFSVLFAASVILFAVRAHSIGARAFAPWLPYVVTEYGVGGSGTLENLGQKVTVLAPWLRALLTCAVLAASSAWLASFLPRLGSIRTGIVTFLPRSPRSRHDWIKLSILLGPFTLAYFALLLPRATFNLAFDRYLLPVFGIFVLAVLRYLQNSLRSHTPRLCFVLLALYSAYGVAATHDYFSTGRARLAAASAIEAKGVPRTEIQGGWEYDGWTQVSAAGYIDDPRLDVPAGAYKPATRPDLLPPACRFDFARLTPAIDPRYFVVFSPQSCLAPSNFQPVSYNTWLPPFHRKIYLQQLPSPGYLAARP